MKACTVVVGVLACFLASSVQSYKLDTTSLASVTNDENECPSGQCPPPDPCHNVPYVKVCVFTAGIARMVVDPKRRRDVFADGFPRLIRNLREMLSHTGELLPGMGAIGMARWFHVVNKVQSGIDVLANVVYELGTPQGWEKVFWLILTIIDAPEALLRSTFEGVDVALAKGGYIEMLKVWQAMVNSFFEYIRTIFMAFWETPAGRALIETVKAIIDWINDRRHQASCRHYFPKIVCDAVDMIMQGVMKLVIYLLQRAYDAFWGYIAIVRDMIVASLKGFKYSLDRFSFPKVVPLVVNLCDKILPTDVCKGFEGVIMSIDKLAKRESVKMELVMHQMKEWLNNHVFIDIEPLFLN